MVQLMNEASPKMKERQIIATQAQRRPYGARVNFSLGDNDRLMFDGEVALLLSRDCIVRFRPNEVSPEQPDRQTLTALVEGFASASEAEQAGLELSLSILWLAVSINCPLRLQYHTPLPCVVYDRTTS